MSSVEDEVRSLLSDDLTLSGTPRPEPAGVEPTSNLEDEVRSLASEERNTELSTLTRSVHFGVQRTPESFAEVVDIARTMGLPLTVAEKNKDELKREMKLRTIDPRTMLEMNPETARFLMDPANAAIASDDIGNLIRAEKGFADFGKGRLASTGSSFMQGVAGIFGELVKSPAFQYSEALTATMKQLDMIDRGEEVPWYQLPSPRVREYQQADEVQRKVIRTQVESEMDPQSYEWWTAGKAIEEGVQEYYKSNPLYKDEFLSGKVPQGFGSMVGFLVTNAVSRLAGGAVSPGMAPTLGNVSTALVGGEVEAVSQFSEALARGASMEDAIKAGGLARIGGYTEALPIARMFDRIDDQTGGSIRDALVAMFKAGTEEAIQESVQTIWGNIIASDLVKYDPDRNAFTGVGEAAGVGFTVGSLTQTLLGLLMGRRAHFRMDPPAPDSAEQNKINELYDIGTQTRVRERAPATFKEHLQQLQETYGPDEKVYIPAEHLQEVLTPVLATIPMNDTLRSMVEQIEEALPVGGEVVVPVADFVADIASDKTLAPLVREIVRLSPDTLSLREAKEVDPNDPLRVLQIVEKADRQAETRAQVDMVVNDIVDQLVRTGVVGERQAQVNARIVGAYFATKAERTGRPVEELFQEAGIEIRGDRAVPVPDQIFEPGQDFGDATLEDEFVIEGSGERVKTKQRAQDVWDEAQERRTAVTQLMECLYG